MRSASGVAMDVAKTVGQGAISAAEGAQYIGKGTAAIIVPAAGAVAAITGAIAEGAASIVTATYQGVQGAGQKVYNPQY